MVLAYLKNLLFPSHKLFRNETPSLLPTTTNFTTRKSYGSTQTNNGCETPTSPCHHPSCPRRPSSRPAPSNSKPGNSDTISKPYFDPRVLSDLTIGLSDGLTVPFALTAGLSAFNDTKVVLYGGIAELIAGSISMGLGGWLAGRGEMEFWDNTLRATQSLIDTSPAAIPPLLMSIFGPFNIPAEFLEPIVDSLSKGDSDTLKSFILKFHHNLPAYDEVKARTPLSSAITIAAGYFFGGFIPLLPYFFVARSEVLVGLEWSVGVMVACLFAFGCGKTLLVAAEAGDDAAGKSSWRKAVRGGVEMVLVGGVAAAAAMGIVRALSGM